MVPSAPDFDEQTALDEISLIMDLVGAIDDFHDPAMLSNRTIDIALGVCLYERPGYESGDGLSFVGREDSDLSKDAESGARSGSAHR